MRWKTTEEDREETLALIRRMRHSESERMQTNAIKAQIAIEAQNQKDEHHARGDTLHVDGAMDVKAVAERLEADPDYIEYQRRRACESDTDAGAICQISDSTNGQPVANGSPPKSTRPRSGSSRNGSK